MRARVAILAVLGTLLLAGCGGAPATNTPPGATAAEPPPTPTATAGVATQLLQQAPR